MHDPSQSTLYSHLVFFFFADELTISYLAYYLIREPGMKYKIYHAIHRVLLREF
jgi:hypothetical protein